MLHTHQDIDFKQVNKNLKKELKELEFNISNQSCLNLTAKALGYNNYNTYKALVEDKVINTKSKNKNDSEIRTLGELEEIYIKEKNEKYPISFENKFKKMQTGFNNFEIFIDKEEEVSYLLYRLRNNITRRVFYAPRYDSLIFYVAPDVKNPDTDYYIKIDVDKKDLTFRFFDILNHLKFKWFFDNDFLKDTLELMNSLKTFRDEIINHSKN